MKINEIREKSIEELQKIFSEQCQKRQELNFKVASGQLKNVREIRKSRNLIARVLTVIKEKK